VKPELLSIPTASVDHGIHAAGTAILRCKRDDEEHDRAGETQTATHHDVRPLFDAGEP
jgi:hypothetical protein